MFRMTEIRLPRIVPTVVFVSATLFCVFALYGQRPEPSAQINQEIRPIAVIQAHQLSRTQRIREGTAVKDLYVFFRQTGDRTAMYTVDDNRRFVCLENLTLERILTTIEERPERQIWKIEGEFTEFRGENRVLIRRAVFAQPPAAVPVLP